MRPWDYVLRRLRKGLKGDSEPRSYALDADLETKLVTLARQENRSTGEVEADLIEAGLAQRDMQNDLVGRWESLSPREQQVAALTCLGFTNRQISVRLFIAVETVKTHMRNLLIKFNLHSKGELKKVLQKWDFSEWEK